MRFGHIEVLARVAIVSALVGCGGEDSTAFLRETAPLAVNRPPLTPVLRLTQSGSGATIVTEVSSMGALTTRYADSVLATLMDGVLLRYRDDAIFELDFVNQRYTQSALSDAVDARVSTRTSFASGVQTAGATIPAQATVRRTASYAPILGFMARAYEMTVNGIVSRVWYTEGAPLPPKAVRKTLASLAVAGTNTDCDCDDVTEIDTLCGAKVTAMELAGRVALRSEALIDGTWTTTMDTTKTEWERQPSTFFDPPSGWAHASPTTVVDLPRATALSSAPAGVISRAATVTPHLLEDGSNLSAVVQYAGGPLLHHAEVHVYLWGASFADPANAGAVGELGKAVSTIVSGAAVGGLAQYNVDAGTVAPLHTIASVPPAGIQNFPANVAATTALVVNRMFADGPLFWWNTGPDPLFLMTVNDDEIHASAWNPFHLDAPSPTFLLPFPVNLLAHDFMPWILVGTDPVALTMPSNGPAQRNFCDGSQAAPADVCPALIPFDQTTTSIAHEVYEAMTDPYEFTGFSDPSKQPAWTESEVCDICDLPLDKPQNRWTRVGDTIVETYWSNEAQDCVGPWFPTIKINHPAPQSVIGWFGPSAPIGFSATVSDPVDGGPRASSEVAWFVDGTSVKSGSDVVMFLPAPGQHTVRAVFTNPETTFSVADSVTFTASDAVPSLVIDSPSDGTTVSAGTTVTFSGHGASRDYPSGLPDASLVWSQDGTLIGEGSMLPVTLGHPGDTTIALSASDSLGLFGTTSIQLHVTPPASGTAVQITSPADGYKPPWSITSSCDFDTLICGVPVSLAASATAPDGTAIDPAQIQWSDDLDGFIGAGASITHSFTIPACVSTVVHVTATATAPDGSSAADTILVNFVSHGC